MAAIDLDKDQWQQLKVALTEALKLSADSRAEMLNRALANTPTLRDHALEMLRFYEKSTRRFGLTETAETQAVPADGSRQPELKPGTLVGNYRIVRKLGQGGMGVVYLANDERLGRQVALKLLSQSVRGKLIDSKGQLLGEARSAAVLNHPGIVTFHDVVEYSGELVAVMEYVEGRPLTELIAEEPLPLGFALRLAGQLADALAYAHSRGIIHCDLKPANIHVLPNGATKILDFGIARAVARPADDAESMDAPVFGTPGYLSPERLLGREATASSDVYALGVVLYQLLAGVPPFPTDDEARLFLDTLTTIPPSPSSLVPGIPPEVDEIVLRCLSKAPRERLQPHELLRALNGVLRELETAPIPFTPSAKPTDGPPYRGSGRISTGPIVTGAPNTTVARIVFAGLATLVALTFVGFITSISYHGPLGLSGRFATESPLWWPVWGFRSLIAVAGGLVILSLAILTVTGVCRLAYAIVGPVRRWCDPILASARRLTEPLRATPTAILAPALLLAQLVLFGLLVWRFDAILNGLDSLLTRRSTENLWALGPQNHGDQNLLIQLLSGDVLVFGVAWYWMFNRAAERDERDGRAVMWGGIAVLVFSVLIFQITPFRVVYHSAAERVLYNGERCYLVGQRANEAVLFCARQSAPLDQVVNTDAPDLRRLGVYESIFAGFDKQR